MSAPEYDDVLVFPGRHFTALAEIDQDRFDDMIRYLCDAKPGALLPKTLYRIEDRANRIYALKPRDERFFNFTTAGAKVILTNAYHKHSQRMTRTDLERLKLAARYREDYLARVKGGVYYEAQS